MPTRTTGASWSGCWSRGPCTGAVQVLVAKEVPTMPGISVANELDVAGEARLYGAMRWFWHPVMYASELAGAPRGAVVLGEPVVLVRLAGEVRCFADLCAHRGT